MIAAFSVTPIGIGEEVAEAVAAAVKVVRASGLPHRTDAMFTSVEGDWDEVMAVIKEAVEAVKPFANRVSTVIKIDDRGGVTDGLTRKMASLERRLTD
ncbi:MTH1187 family thiamine-binding protein [Kitasatospora sp. NPDC006697]|uniref:MTH1187 family thiamine-binding protein n=1 Tax=Kitasatospora sp. NPDC006697 TaxID=3364020 RepID=UPI0036866CA8